MKLFGETSNLLKALKQRNEAMEKESFAYEALPFDKDRKSILVLANEEEKEFKKLVDKTFCNLARRSKHPPMITEDEI